MFSQRLGKGVPARTVRDEIELVGLQRIQGRCECRPPRVANWARRQALNPIGVIGVRRIQIFARERSAKRLLSVRGRVGNSWIGLEPHAPSQSIDEDARHARAFFRDTGFPFDNGREYDCFNGVVKGQAWLPVGPKIRQQILHRL